jgi:hypothetical protein
MSSPPNKVERTKILKRANPNHHGFVDLVHYTATTYLEGGKETHEELWYVVVPEDGCGDPDEFPSYGEALKFWEEQVAFFANLPNWEAQDEYDEKWGAPLPTYPSAENY